MDVLRYAAFQKFGADHKVTVYHFVIYVNAKSRLRSQAVFAGIGGVLGAVAANAVANNSSSSQTKVIDRAQFEDLAGEEEYERAQYSYDEDPNNAPVYIVYIDTDIDGKRVFTRTVAPVQQLGDASGLAAAVQLAVDDHLSDYGNSLVATTAPSVPHPAAPVISAQPAPTASATPAPVPSLRSAAPPPQVSAADTVMMSKAQDIANQLGCGVVQSSGVSDYIAPCGDHGIYIGCGDNACRPMHTVNIKANE